MSKAALPTDFIVIAEKRNGNIAPTNNPVNTSGSSRFILSIMFASGSSRSALVRKAEKRARDVKIAEPMAKPFPIAAVVFPAESSTSVLSRIFSPIPVISAIPPALSATGPYASIVNPTTRVLNIPIAATATPYIPASVNGKNMLTARIKIEPVAL